MKKSVLSCLSLVAILSFTGSVLAQAKVTPNTPSVSVPKNAEVKNAESKKEMIYKVEWTVKKTGKVVVTRSVMTSLNDPENIIKTGKIVFTPQRVANGDSSYLLGLGLDMKLFNNQENPVLAMVGNYTDPNELLDFTEKMPDERNVAHPVIGSENVKLVTGETFVLNTAKFFKAYDVSKPNNQPVTFTRFILKEPKESSLIEVSFRVYEFEMPEEEKK